MRNTKKTSLLRTSLHARTDTREDDPDAAEGFKDLFVFLAFLVWTTTTTTTRGSIFLLLETRVVSTHLSAHVFPFFSFGFLSLCARDQPQLSNLIDVLERDEKKSENTGDEAGNLHLGDEILLFV